MPRFPDQMKRWSRPENVVKPFDWSLTGPVRRLRGDIQELILFPILRAVVRLRVENKEHLQDLDGPVVIVANHTSHFDCPIVLAALPYRIRTRTIVAAAADYFYRTKALGALTSLALGTVPFEREGSRESLDRLKEGIRRGWSVLIFPEGTRSKTGKMRRFRAGASYLCVDTRCAALPILIKGAFDIMPKGRKFPRPGKVTVRFGRPVGPRPDDDYESMNERIYEAMLELGSEAEGGPAG